MPRTKKATADQYDPYGDDGSGKPVGAINASDIDPDRDIDEQLDEIASLGGKMHDPNEPPARIVPPGHETDDDKANRGNSSTKPQSKRKAKEEPVARTFSVADNVGPVAKLLIADHYAELAHQDIRYVFTSKASEIDGAVVVCKPSKLSGLAAWLAGGSEDGEASPMFVVVISESHWGNMPQRGKEAFLDNALACFAVSKTGALKMKNPDVREHSAVLARYGFYSAELKKQRKLIQQAFDQPSLELAS